MSGPAVNVSSLILQSGNLVASIDELPVIGGLVLPAAQSPGATNYFQMYGKQFAFPTNLPAQNKVAAGVNTGLGLQGTMSGGLPATRLQGGI